MGGDEVPMRDGQTIRAKIFSDAGTYAEDDIICLRAIRPSDKEDYLNIYRAKEIWKGLFANPDLHAEEGMWNDFNSPSILNTVIIRKADGAFCGFCGLQEFTELDAPELSVELIGEFQGQGLGARALALLMKRFAEVTGSSMFASKVSCGNVASQKLMRKLGGKPSCIVPFPGVSQSMLQMMEDDEDAQIPSAEALAEEFNTTPRKLRSHVLVFKFG